MKDLKLQLIKMEVKVEDNDNYERRDTLVLSGSNSFEFNLTENKTRKPRFE